MKANNLTVGAQPASVKHQHFIWIERLAMKLRLPVWATILLYQGILAVAFPVVYYGVGAWKQFVSNDAYFAIVLLVVATAFFFFSIYIRREMTALEQHALSMVEGPQPAVDKLAPIASFRGVFILGVLFNLLTDIPFFTSKSGTTTLFQDATISFGPWVPLLFVVGSFLWVFGYAMVAIYRIGKLPMVLHPFTKDRTLGLGPFASVSIKLIAMYYFFIAVQFSVDFVSFGITPFVIIRDTGLVLLGLALFFLPLLSLRAKLLEAKRREMNWVSERYSKVMAEVKAGGDGLANQTTLLELLSIDKIQKDIHSIRSWPFDTGALAKLLAIVLSTTAILLSKVVASFLHLV